MLLGPASSIKAVGIAQSKAAGNRAQKKKKAPPGGAGYPTSVAGRNYRGGGGGGGRGYRGGVSRPGGGGGVSVPRGRVGRGPAAPKPPRYAGPPPPSAAMIAQLAAQLGGIGRRYNEAGATYKAGLGQAGSARKAFLQQLSDFYTQQQNQLAEQYQARGLLQSGLYNEALGNLGKQRAAQQGQYESDYRGTLADLLRTLTTTRSELTQEKATLSDRYNQQRADRARILRLMGA